jgi:hypothetical protein
MRSEVKIQQPKNFDAQHFERRGRQSSTNETMFQMTSKRGFSHFEQTTK